MFLGPQPKLRASKEFCGPTSSLNGVYLTVFQGNQKEAVSELRIVLCKIPIFSVHMLTFLWKCSGLCAKTHDRKPYVKKGLR